jgi:hypothetical protein
MAIKINNTTVIDDSRNFIGVALTATSIYASGSVGTAGSVLTATAGGGIEWAAAAAAGGSGTFDTGITTSVYISVTSGIATGLGDTPGSTSGITSISPTATSQLTRNNDIFIGPGIAYSFPSTAGIEYVIESIHITNKSGNNLYLSGRHDFNGSQNVPIANRILVPYQGALELLEQPRIANPSDIIRLQALAGVGTQALGVDGGLDAFITISTKNDTDYVGIGTTITSTDQELFTSVTYPSVLQSISLSNYNNNVDADVTVSVFRGGTVGGISTTGVRLGYLTYNLTVPKNSNIEILQKPKLLLAGDSILVTSTPTNSVGIVLAGKYIV